MQNPSLVCGNCGKVVAPGDVTCPHCDVLLAAYASPVGSTTAYVYESSEPIADAVPEAKMYVPAPAPPVEIPDEVEIASTAPRPLFDTQLTIEEIARAAEGGHEESLVVVSEKKIATRPKEFEVPDYAKPPADAKPVELVDGGDEGLIARAAESPSTPPAADSATRSRESGQSAGAKRAAERERREAARSRGHKPRDESEPSAVDKAHVAEPETASLREQPSYSLPPRQPESSIDDVDQMDAEHERRGESWLYDLSKSGPIQPDRPVPRDRGRRPEPTRTTTLPPTKRGATDSYLRKLHAETGYESDQAHLSKPVDTESGTGWKPGMSKTKEIENLAQSRKGCSVVLYIVLFFMWISVIIGILNGDLNTGLLMAAIVFSFLARFLNKQLPNERK